MENMPELMDYLGNKLWHLENTYLVLSEVYLHYNVAVDKEAAQAYLKVINSHKGFFMPVVKALEFELYTGMHSYLGKKDARSLGKAVNKLASSKGGIDLTKQYDELLNKHTKIIHAIEVLRDKRLAHDDVEVIEVGETLTSDAQFISLFKDVKIFLNSVMRRYNKAEWFMDGDAREAIKDTHDLMNTLLRGESQRLNEIDVEFTDVSYRSGKTKWLASE